MRVPSLMAMAQRSEREEQLGQGRGSFQKLANA